jgi:hypothetical protein
MKITNKIFYTSILAFSVAQSLQSATPLGMFAPYDINIKLKKPATGNWQFNVLGEKSYNVHGYATNADESKTYFVNVLQIYEPLQNIVSMYQGFDDSGSIVQTITTPFTQLLDSVAGGAGGGVSNLENGIYQPCGTLSCGQVAFGMTYGFGQGFYVSTFLPVCFAKLSNVSWTYRGNSTLFSGAQIQTELVDTFAQDVQTYFNLNVGGWKKQGLGDLTFLAEYQREFAQRRPILKNVQVNARFGISVPTAKPADESVIMPVPFGADGAIGFPFGAGLGLSLSHIAEIGFSGQFWCFLSNEKCRRIQTFPTQTSLLYPLVVDTYKKYAILQNFNLYAQLYSPGKRVSAKMVYQHWRRQKEMIYAMCPDFNLDVINSALNLEEFTRHQIALFGIYSPLRGDFERFIPQFEIFWKGSFGGMRAATASTFGAQFSLIF